MGGRGGEVLVILFSFTVWGLVLFLHNNKHNKRNLCNGYNYMSGVCIVLIDMCSIQVFIYQEMQAG